MSTATRYRLKDVADLLSDLAGFPDDFSRRMHLTEHYPHIPANFWRRCTPTMVLTMDPEQLIRVLTYADPVGEHATNLAMGSRS